VGLPACQCRSRSITVLESPFHSVGLAGTYGIGEAPYTLPQYPASPILPFVLVVIVLIQALGRLFLYRYTMQWRLSVVVCKCLGPARFGRYTRFWKGERCWHNASVLPGKGTKCRLALPALVPSLLIVPRSLSSFARLCPRKWRLISHMGMICDSQNCFLCTPASYREGFRFSRVEAGNWCSFIYADSFLCNVEVSSRGHKDGHVIGISHHRCGAWAASYPCI